MKIVKIGAVVVLMGMLSGCGGYNEEECFQSATDYMENLDGEVMRIPGEKWRYIGLTDSDIVYMEAMAHTHCGLTKTSHFRK